MFPDAHLWSLVLAAGSGVRLAGLTAGCPKQFWRPDGRKSLLDRTLLRLAPMSPTDRTIVVVSRAHDTYVRGAWLRAAGHVLRQPSDRGTAAGLLFGLLPILAGHRTDNDIVVVSPADHAFGRPSHFRRGVIQAVAAVRAGVADVVVFGARACEASEDLGWLILGPPTTPFEGAAPLHRVLSFIEKPPREEALRLLTAGAAWSTMVLVADVQGLLQLFQRHLPGLLSAILGALSVNESRREAYFEACYASLLPADLSRDLLTPAEDLLALCWPASAEWTDLGTPQRIARWRAAQRTGAEALPSASSSLYT